jgi:antitoxin (DNA-binding transcriptional repressor) of toxin-antitoxin stability system
MAGGTKLGRTDEMVDLLRQILSETKQGKSVTVSVDGQPLATAVARNASLTPAASNLGPRPLR